MSIIPSKSVFLSAAALVFALNAPVQAQSGDGAAVSDQAKQEIVEEVINELRGSEALKEAVREGIQDFIREQQQAQAQAQQRQREKANKRAADVRPVSMDRDHVYGNPDAPITLIEYSDFECPYCKRFHPTARELVDSSDGQVNWVYRHFPLSFHNPGAQEQAEASECAAELGGNDAFWAYTDAIYERTSSGGDGFPRSRLVPLAVEIGLDEESFSECLESGRHEERVKADLAEGVRAGVSGTPGNILLNNETGEALARAGAQPLDALKQAVEELSKGGDS
ncbi:MAG TPA: DsbA family protein [Arenicellales bacterium]|nr:DsbA family protein [Arenicellales bacterium]